MRVSKYAILPCILSLWILLLSAASGVCKPLCIVFFYPTSEENTYWPQVLEVLNSVAADLDIVLEPHGFDVNNRFSKSLTGAAILRREPRPDGAILSVAFGQSEALLQITEELKIPTLLQGPLFPDELEQLGSRPRNRYSSWVGYFYQNEEEKGYQLGKILIQEASNRAACGEDGRIHVVGIGGDLTWFGSSQRNSGLIRAVSENPQAVLHQVVPSNWTVTDGQRIAAALLERYPETSVIWTASDQLAVGAAKALKQAGKQLGKTGFTGGLDLSPVGFQQVENGSFVATTGSPLLAWGQVLIYLYDYLNGKDFAIDPGAEFSMENGTATPATLAFYREVSQSYRQLDFRSFSKVYRPDLQRYDFSEWYPLVPER